MTAECGTRPGYAAHLKANEPACDECSEANAKYSRDVRSRGLRNMARTIPIDEEFAFTRGELERYRGGL